MKSSAQPYLRCYAHVTVQYGLITDVTRRNTVASAAWAALLIITVSGQSDGREGVGTGDL
jgi:hypothetical protein